MIINMKKLLVFFVIILTTFFTSAVYAQTENPQIHSHCICGKSNCTESHSESVNWQAWNGDTSVGTANDNTETAVYLYLEKDVTITSTLSISNVTVYLCLNGNTLTIDNAGNPAVRVGENQKFVLCDCGKTGKITGAKGSARKDNAYFGTVNCRPGSDFVMYGGSISDNTVANANGGGIFVNGGTFTMYDGFLNNNKAPNGSGGAISVENGTINTFGGKMNGNSAINGGAIHLKGNTKGEIRNIKADSNAATGGISRGGAIYTETSGIIKFYDIELSQNTANHGGGIYLDSVADNVYANMYNIDIRSNSVTGNGGGIYLDGNGKGNPSTSMYDVKILQNESGSDGAGIFMTSGAMLNLRGGFISDNTCTAGGGGGIRAASGTYVSVQKYDNPLYIKGNTANLGGGISASGNAFVVGGGCIIEENTARQAGGGVYVDYIYTWCIFNGTTITKNTAPIGGGFCLNKKNNEGRQLEISNGTTIIGNTSSEDNSPSNLYLKEGNKFQFRKGLTGNEKIGVSVSKTPTMSEATCIESIYDETWHDTAGDRSNLIIPDDDNYKVVYKNNMHWLALKPTVVVTTEKIAVFNLDRAATLYVASYDGNRVLDVKSVPFEAAENISFELPAIGLNTQGATKLTAFLWDDNMSSLCKSSSDEVTAE